MLTQEISAAHQDYLKTIYLLLSRGQEASNSAIAQALGVAPASATNMVKRLAEAGLIEHVPYRGVQLTAAGQQVALEMVRHHRLIELFLHDVLEMPWDQVHVEAERLEHAISEEVEEAIARKLGYPTFDPHGDPIPDRHGRLAAAGAGLPLTALEPGCPARLTRVHAQDGERLRYLGELGLYPGAQVTVSERAPFQGPLLVQVNGAPQMLAFDLAAELSVEMNHA
ncbi:MAG: metal-dependent transcriptional regulator [Anaerolinea sp.]|nr:metal-dependent transcriptional regulator [Anaerolinea sp.]